MTDFSDEDIVHIPINGELDLHCFRPSDIKTLVPDYLEECLKAGIFNVRIIHGKGTGALRKGVEALLKRSPLVESYRIGDEASGSWGATLVVLKKKP